MNDEEVSEINFNKSNLMFVDSVPADFIHNDNQKFSFFEYHNNIIFNDMMVLFINPSNGYIEDVNNKACEFYGYSKIEFKNMNISCLDDTLSEKECLHKLKKSLESHFQRFYFKHHLANGEIRDVKVYAGPIRKEKKQLIYYIIEDITNEINMKFELKKKDIQYKTLFDNANDAVFFVECDNNGLPKRFIDVNITACELLGYPKKELLNISPLDINADISSVKGFADYFKKQRAKFETKIIAKNGCYIPLEVSIHAFELNNKKVYVAIGRDITARKHLEEKTLSYSKLLESILIGIPDIIGVYNLDQTIMFYNEAGYEFYKKTSDDVKGKKCYEMLCRTSKCVDCHIVTAIKTKKIIRKQRYISEVDRYVDCCWNPVLDDYGEVMFVIEQLRDITEKKKLEDILNESKENYRHIVNLLPDAVIITVDGTIVTANQAASKYFDPFLGEKIYKFAPGYEGIIKRRLAQTIKNKSSKTMFDYKIVFNDTVIDIEVLSSYLNYKGKPAVLSLMRDITKRKKELTSAAKVQKKALQKKFPFPDKIKIESLYVPAKTVSGDFFYFHEADDDLLIGILGDVSGKGITAALSISAFNVLFHEAVLISDDPSQIINILNKKIVNYLDERYIAVCCFSLDFKTNKAKIIGAGINQFITKNNNGKCCERIIKGPFLGMFENSEFGEMMIDFESGDRFYFLSDGLEFIFENKQFKEDLETATLTEFKNYLYTYLHDLQINIDGIKDDSTLLALEIR